MLSEAEVREFATNHTVRECCKKFNKSYSYMYHYMKDREIHFVKQEQSGKKNSNYKHGYKHTRIYHIWIDIRQRCNNPHNHAYANYGGRGIKVCEDWNNFTAFLSWSKSNGYSDNLTIDRIDVNKGYCPDNCRWVSRKVQSINKRNNRLITYKGQTKTLREWADSLHVNYDKLRYRLDNWSNLDEVFDL
jgi:hypothetical protein